MSEEAGTIQAGQPGAQAAGITADNWRELIPPEYSKDPSLANIKDFGSLVKGFVSAQSMIGAEKLALPMGKNDTPEYWGQVFDKLGRPKDPDGYTIKIPEADKLPKGIEVNADRLKGFKSLAHEIGLLPGQVEKLFSWHMGEVLKDFEGYRGSSEKAYESALTEINKRFGAKADEMVQVANRVLQTFGGSPEEQSMISERYGNDPLITGLLAQIGLSMRESALVRGERPSFDLNANDAMSKKKDILGNKENPLHAAYLDKRNPRHKEAVDEVLRLNEIVAGGGK